MTASRVVLLPVSQVRHRPYEQRHQWKETVKWASLFVVVFAVVTNCVFYFTFQISRSDDASIALQQLKSPSRYTLAAGTSSGSSSGDSGGGSTAPSASNSVAGGLSWVVFVMCCGLFVVLVAAFIRSLLVTYPWVARDVSTRALKQLEMASLRGKPVDQLTMVDNPLLDSGSPSRTIATRSGVTWNDNGRATGTDSELDLSGARCRGSPGGPTSGHGDSESNAFRWLGQYRWPSLGTTRASPAHAPTRPTEHDAALFVRISSSLRLPVERVRVAVSPDRTRSEEDST